MVERYLRCLEKATTLFAEMEKCNGARDTNGLYIVYIDIQVESGEYVFLKTAVKKAEHGLYLHQIAMGTAGGLERGNPKSKADCHQMMTNNASEEIPRADFRNLWQPTLSAGNTNLDQETVGLVAQERWYIPGSKESEAFSSRDLREPCVS